MVDFVGQSQGGHELFANKSLVARSIKASELSKIYLNSAMGKAGESGRAIAFRREDREQA